MQHFAAQQFKAYHFAVNQLAGSSGAPTPDPGSSSAGGGGWTPTKRERRRIEEYARHLVRKRQRADEDDTRLLEAAWNKVHGIELPAVLEDLPKPIQQAVQAVQRAPSRQREDRIDDLVDRIADLRAELVAMRDEALRREEEDIVAILLGL